MTDLTQRIESLSPEKRALLMKRLRKRRAEAARDQIIPRREDRDAFPLSYAQQRLWFLDQLETGNPFYNIPSAVRLNGALDVAALRKSLNEVVRRHEVLRATFEARKGHAVQVIAPEMSLALPLVDLRSLPEAEREAEVVRLGAQEARCPFDLSEGPLVRASLIRLGNQEHVVLFMMHHIVSDGWSTSLLIQEIGALYDAFSRGQPSLLPELPIQYADYAQWQRQWLQGDVLERQLDYWRQELGDGPPMLELPTDRPRPPVQAYRGSYCTFELPTDLTEKLKNLSRAEEATLFMTLLAAFQTLLYRYTGCDDVAVGTPVANRNRFEVEKLIGFFVNTLVLRTDLSRNPTFRELLRRVRRVALGAQDHQDLPFEMLVEELQPDRDMSHTPLFQVMFALQNAPAAALELRGLTMRPVEVDSGTAPYDLTLFMEEGEDGLRGALRYNTDLFDAATAKRMVGHLRALLEGIALAPDQPISELPLLSEPERHQMLVEWNDTEVSYPGEQTIHALFEAQVRRVPDAIAVVFEENQLTYAELSRRANQLAHHLQRLGVGPERLVGLCVERSLETVLGVLGILKTGGAYLPLDPSYPRDRLAFMLEDAGVSVVLTQQHLVGDLPLEGLAVVCLNGDWPLIAQQKNDKPVNGAMSGNLAYVIYTSGSTGRPKGVMIQHRSALHLAAALHRVIYASDLDNRLRLSLNAPLPFDASVQQLVMLLHGHTLCVIPDEVRLEGESLLAHLRWNQLDVLDCVPSQLKLLLAAGLLDGTTWVPSSVLPGGEAIDEITWKRLAQAPETEFYNMYGPTECAVDSTIGWVKIAGEHPTIGRPVSNAQLYVLDRQMELLPVGVPGELHIGGAGVGRGYLDRTQLTAESFVPNPFSAEPGARLYKTGDLVRYLPDGNVEFLGRIDHQVKVRGFRIELGEIEAVLKDHGDVQEAVVLAREDLPGDRRLVAYVVPDGEVLPNLNELRAYVKQKLPAYMVPSAFVTLEALPLLPNAKVNRDALPAPDGTGQDSGARFVAPRTPVEELLADIWTQVLYADRVGVRDNFFELGGHSLLATQLISRVRDAFRIELPVRAIFEQPVLAGLAQEVEAALRTGPGLSAPPLERVPREAELPLSFGQQRLWFLDRLEPNSASYNISDVLRIRGPLNLAVLEKTLNEIVGRHEVLRTAFPTVDGEAAQVIAPELRIPLPVADLSGLTQAEREAEVRQLAMRQAQRPFDLAEGPLLRAQLLRLSEEEHVACLTMHHIVSDAWSTGVLTKEIAALYRAFSENEPSPLSDLPVQYADFAHWQREWLQGEALESQLSYWKQQLQGGPSVLALPTDRPRPAVQTFRGARQPLELPSELSESLEALSRSEGATLFMTLLAAFQTLLHRYTGEDDISVGTPIANRNRAEVEGLIGFFVNTLVMRTDLSGDPTFRDLVRRVREMALGAYAHQDLPFEKLVDELQPRRNLSHSPLFQVMFTLQNARREALELPNLMLQPLDIESESAKFDLTLFMVKGEDGLRGSLEYNTDLFDDATISRMLEHFRTLLEGTVVNPDLRISELPLLTGHEQRQLLIDWNDTAAPCPDDATFTELFAAQVERSPGAIAVAFGDETLTYRDLNRRANQLGHYLQKLGVASDTLVGVCLERSLETVVGLLGVLKAGGAYVPLDAAYPTTRLAFMIEDAQVPVLLTVERLVETLPTNGAQVICLDTDWQIVAQERDENPVNGAGPDDLAYVIYTSGSTGKPKGAMILHRGLVNYLTWCQRMYPVAAGQGAPVHSSISFDLTITGLFAPLLAGRTVRLVPEGPGIELLSTALRNESDYSLVKITPAHLELLSHQLSPEEAAGRTRAFIIGGENLLAEKIVFWQDAAPDTLLVNEYGPTETVVGCCVYTVAPNERRTGSVPIGRPIINTQHYVLDKHMQPVPIGIPGELYIGGAGVGRGYLNRPELTSDCFVSNPFGDQSDDCLYKTGDLVRYLPDGNIEFLGRIDQQVKVRGFRIELGEIEAALHQHPAVEKAAVLAREDRPGAKRLVAYVVPKGDDSPTVTGLRQFLTETLPDYMVPATFVTLEALPLTPNGKVDREALPAPEQTRPDLESAYVAPRTRGESTLTDIWASVLGVERIGVRDNFFELGGDSILVIQVIARANQAGLKLSPRQLFQHPTVSELAAVAGQGPAVHAEQGTVKGLVPLTPIQRWFFDQDLPEPHHWNQAFLLEVKDELRPELLEEAVEHLLAHHDALRLRFEQAGVGWRQVNAGLDGDGPFAWADLSRLPRAQQTSAIEAQATALQASLDLAAGPLMRVAYFDLGDGRPSRLLIVIHHLAVDGVSWRVLLEDLQTAYEQLKQGETVVLPPKTTSFRYWAERLEGYAEKEDVQKDLAYWLGMADAELAPLPIDHPDGTNTEATTDSVTVGLDEEETRALLQDVPAAYGTEINDALLTALVEAFESWAERRVLLVDLEGHGRVDMFEGVDLSRTVGWFTAVHPVLLDLRGVRDPGEAVRTVKEQLRAVPRRGIGYGLLRYLSEDEEVVAQLRSVPPAQVSFNYLGQFDQIVDESPTFGPAPESPGPSRSLKGDRTHLLILNGGIVGGRLRIEWAYSGAMLERETVRRVAESYIETLRAIIEHCQSSDAVGYTPSDFPDVELSQQEIEGMMAEIGAAV
jgi:amino acid adenylation domain-containing protein/non-ribosomal peptide synthase protein (TIGR01720 family)